MALSKAAAAWREAVRRDFALDETGERLLEQACIAYDRLREAQRVLAEEGITFQDRFGQPRPHPCVVIERDCTSTLVRLVRQLNLDVEPILAPGRPSGGSRNAYQSN